MNEEKTTGLEKLVPSALDCLGVAVTIIDPRGKMLYYNQHAARIVDRKPEYIGNDIHSHHKKAATNEKLDSMIQAFKEGREEPFRYEAKPYGTPIFVSVAPILKEGKFLGCVQTVVLKEEVGQKSA
ncbi:PAS domain-containing protein [Thermodesulfobacteriota bacterium]